MRPALASLALLVAAACGSEPVVPADPLPPADAFTSLSPAVPPNVADCAKGACAGTSEVRVCLDGATACDPKRTTTVEFRLNGEPFGALGVRVQSPGGVPQIEASGASWAWAGFAMTNGASSMTLASDAELQLTYLNLAPVWGGTTRIDLLADGRGGPLGDSFFYRFAGDAAGDTPGELATRLETIAARLIGLTDLTPPRYRAWLMPTELAIIVGGEGNLSFGDGTVTINYGNPEWTATQGGVAAVVTHEFSHEFTHTLFAQIASEFPGNATCLNEGLADALGAFAGYVPFTDFGTAQDGSDFTTGCRASTEIHAKGNCVLWNAAQAGLLTVGNVGRLFHPGHDLDFDSCDLASPRTGNAYVVYLTEALGQDASAFVRSIGLENAGSYDDAKAALGR
jgi:hypothetical protein